MLAKSPLYFTCFILGCFFTSNSQKKELKLVLKESEFNWTNINSIAQDKQGYIWLGTRTKGIERFDGTDLKEYLHDENDKSSISGNWIQALYVDSSNFLWIGTYGFGLNRLDLSSNKFVHFRHKLNDLSSLSNDTVTAILRDHLGNIWIGSFGGIDLLNPSTGKFKHYNHIDGDSSSLSHNHVRVIYEDLKGTVWVGTGSPYYIYDNELPDDGGLNRFDAATGKFKRYIRKADKPETISNNKVVSIFEDSKRNFWIGTAGDGLQILDRNTNIFTHFYYDSLHPGNLSRPPLNKKYREDHISFIKEDDRKQLWIGTYAAGINCYDPERKILTHYDKMFAGSAIPTKDSLFWMSAEGNLYATNFPEVRIPYFPVSQGGVNAVLFDYKKNQVWVGTNHGIICQDIAINSEKIFTHDAKDPNSISNDTVNAICLDNKGFLWLATYGGGLNKFDPGTNKSLAYRHTNDIKSIASDNINDIFIDSNEKIWIATADAGVDKFNRTDNSVTHFTHSNTDSNSLLSNSNFCINEDKNGSIWIGSDDGLTKINMQTAKVSNYYLASSYITGICTDASGSVWAGGHDGVYQYNKEGRQFLRYKSPNSKIRIGNVLSVLQGDKDDIWISTSKSIIRINTNSNDIRLYNATYGINENTMFSNCNFKSPDGKLYFAAQAGYYSFYPERIRDYSTPHLLLSAFYLGENEINNSNSEILKEPLWMTTQIHLKYDQNNFSFDFPAIDYQTPEKKSYMFMLENYDNNWQNTGEEHKAYFFKVPPGKYIFHAKAINANGVLSEKSISIIISPPWWKTLPAYILYLFLFLTFSFVANRYVRNRILEKEKIKNREKELLYAKEIQKAYDELKSTQAQLIQSEKLASLGQLTAGIAHEIQNPLNFVNNFADVNKELLVELKQEADKGNIQEVKAIATDVIENSEKISHHGKRADAIVKGMLQHSQKSVGEKVPTDINALAEEYLRLSYHGLRAKDKSFNAALKTDFDETIGKINIIPQDMGRVLLNLYNNAFYAVNEKSKGQKEKYQPVVSVSTKKIGDKVEIKVTDNGNGIPQKVIDKIFQPFFTTKPTGQGTGLGLSLSYDIVKAHGGEIKVTSKQAGPDEPAGWGTAFIIQLPVN